MLNHQFVDTVKGLEKPKKYFDGQGLYLYVQPSEAKYWRLKYRYEGREKTYAIGVYPRISLEEARLKTDEAKQQLKQGIDPSEFKQNQGFEVVAREWFENEREGWKARHAEIVINSLETDVFPYIGSRNVGAIRSPELLAVIRRIEKRGALRVAEKVLQRIRAVFRYAIQTGRAASNPASELIGVIKTRRVQHRLVIEKSDLPGFIQTVRRYSGLFPVDVIERQLAHVEGNAVRRAYNHAQYMPERVRMMQWWADYLDEVQQVKSHTAGIVGKLKGFFGQA